MFQIVLDPVIDLFFTAIIESVTPDGQVAVPKDENGSAM